MSGLNKAMVIGNLGDNPDVRQTTNGTTVANLSIATSEKWKDKQTGELKENTEWHRIVLFGRLAEIARDYLVKGSQAYFEGRLQTRKWQDNNGNDRYTTEIVANELRLLGGKSSNNNAASSSHNEPVPTQTQPQTAPPADFDDDLPF